jgi:hypothetical protein
LHTYEHPARQALHRAVNATALDLARRRAINAERANWTPEQRAQYRAEQERRLLVSHEHRVRAKEAQKRQRKPRPTLPPPERTRRYCQPIAIDPVLDRRLCPGAARCLVLIMSECGRYRHRLLNNGYLANLLHRSERQVQRYISQLVALGYIKTWPQLDPITKATTGRFIRPLAPCFPYWHPDGPGDIEKPLSRWNHCRDTNVSHELSKTKRVYIERKLSTARNPAEDPMRHRRQDPQWNYLADDAGAGDLSFQEDEVRYGYDPDRRARGR